jgi:superfamily II DNA or RNA helicase
MQLYEHQTRDDIKISNAFFNHRVLMFVAPTGYGKTVLFTHRIMQHRGASCLIAHRKELLQQASLTLAKRGITHRVVAPKDVIKRIRAAHRSKLGRSFYDANASAGVASVDTMCTPTRLREFAGWYRQVTFVIIDEGHHVLRDNKWGKAAEQFPTAKILLVTATPQRADGFGLGDKYAGIAEHLITTVSPRWLIQNGFLTPYRIIRPPSDFSRADIKLTANGELSQKQAVNAVRKSRIMGDAVDNYQKWIPGEQSVGFCASVELAHEEARAFTSSGIPALAVDGNTDPDIREEAVNRLEAGDINALFNVGLFGEGVDLPCITGVLDLAPTSSLCSYMQRFGRVLRIAEGKTLATYIDQVCNTWTHGRPDASREWTLAGKRPGDREDDGTEPQRMCVNCTDPYPRYMTACPGCGNTPPPPASRKGPQFVDGDLVEMDDPELQALRDAVARADTFKPPPNAAHYPHASGRHDERVTQQMELRENMATFAGLYSRRGRTDREIQKLFFLSFGTDVLTAKALPRAKAAELNKRVETQIWNLSTTPSLF